MDQPAASPHPEVEVSFSRLLKELQPYRRWLMGGLVCLILASPTSVFHPFVWMFVVDEVLQQKKIHLLVPALMVMVVIQAFSIVLGAMKERLFEKAGQSFVRDLRNRIYSKINRQSLRYIHSQRTGDLSSRVISDVDAMEKSVIGGITSLMEELLSFIIVLSAVLWINPKVGLVTIIPLTIAYFMVRAYNGKVKGIYRKARELLGEVGARLQDNLSGIQVIQSFNRQSHEEARFAEATDRYFQKSMEGIRLKTFVFPLVGFVGFTTNVIMLGLGAWFVWRGEFTLGGLVAYRGFWWQLNSPIRSLAQLNDQLQRAIASSRRVYEVLDTPEDLPDAPDAIELKNPSVPVIFENVHFAYDNGKVVFRDLSFQIAPGELIALAGTSGAGKTTLMYLLARFYDPTKGRILLGDRALPQFKNGSLHAHMGMVLQDTFLFNDSVSDNIRYGRPQAPEEEVVTAAKRANAHDFILRLPEGYRTVIGERGVKLSGGQRQRISVARAFLADPKILLLDEPTSSVEPESELIIQQSLEELMKGRTTIISSHRPSLLKQADRILFLHHGRIEEQGSHQELIARKGQYAQMYRHWEEEDLKAE